MRRLCAASRRRQRGFTLIEILIVVAIVGILAAILFPTIGRVRAGARAATCASNLKQIGLAMFLYAGDNNGRLMKMEMPPNEKFARCGWPDYFFRYARDSRIFQCPDDDLARVYNPACTETDAAPVKDGAGGYNLIADYLSLTRNNPANILVAIDGTGAWAGPNVSPDGKSVTPESIAGAVGAARHLNAYNVVFGDGHAKRLGADKLSDPKMWGR